MRRRAGTRYQPPLGRTLAAAAACAIAFGALAGSASAISNLPQVSPSIVVDGTVNAVVSTGSTIVLGGSFSRAGAYTGGFVGAPVAGGTPSLLPAVNGTVNAVVSDGSGGWYVGGSFTAVGTTAITNLAHITSGGGVDSGWNPAPNGQVNALALSSDGKTLFVGGAFATIGGSSRNYIAALTASTGVPTSWNPNADNSVTLLVLSPDGSTLYVGGSFTAIGGGSRSLLAALATASGSATSWNPSPTSSSTPTVNALSVSSDGTVVYVGGHFETIGGASRTDLAALSASSTGSATTWTPQANGTVTALTVSSDGNTVYAGGTFTMVGGQARTDLGAVSASTGNATSWDPGANGSVTALAISSSGSPIYVGGTFTAIGGQSREDVAALSTSDATATSWQEDANGQVSALAVTSSIVAMGGSFSGVGLSSRSDLAAISTSGSLLSFDPSANGTVYALALSPDASTLYVGGAFTTIGAQARAGLASVSLASGVVGSWNPGVSGNTATVNALATAKDSGGNTIVYVGGNFTTIAGTSQKDLGEIDASGSLVSWNPNPTVTTSAAVNALLLATDSNGHVTTVYAGGGFTVIGGQSYKYVAALDPTTASAVTWSSKPTITAPTVSATAVPVSALARNGTTLYIGGDFTKINATGTGVYIAALDTATGALSSWNPVADGAVTSLALSSDGATVYAGGAFTTIGTGSPTRNSIAALVASSGAATTWNPNITGSPQVNALVLTGSSLVAGGTWTTVGSAGLPDLAVFAFDVPAATVNPSVSGTATVGSTLTCATGTWTNAPSGYTYQWLRDGSSIGSATTSTYVLVSGDLGHQISCKVTASNAEGSGNATSAAVLVVQAPVNTVAPVVNGTATVDSLLTCDAGTWTYSPTYSYAWLRNGSVISGAVSGTYTVASSDSGQTLACRVTGTNAGGSSIATSAAVAIASASSSSSSGSSSSGSSGGGGTTTSPPPTTGAAQTADVSQNVGSSLNLASIASVSWSTGTFTAPGVLSASPLTLAVDVDGFSHSSRAVSVVFAPGGASTVAAAFLPNPLAITFAAPSPKAVIPAYSEQGSSWTPLATLTSAELGAGLLDGYYRLPDGSIVVFTRHTGDFALLQDIQPPTKPTAIVASLVKTTLRLAWPPSADNSRRIRAYQILRGKTVVRTIPGGHTVGTLNLTRLTKSGSYSVRAIDYAGNAGPASRAVKIVVKPRPSGVPTRIPAWALKLQLWTATAKSVRGARPATPAPLPSWYRTWSRWTVTRLSLRP